MSGLREVLLDVIKHTNAVGSLNTVKFTCNEKTYIESMDDDRTIILKAELKEPLKELSGEFGMTRFSLLEGFLNFANYRTDAAFIDVRTRNDGSGTPQELVFDDNAGQTSTYRFMAPDLLPDQAKFLGKDWEVEFEPTRSKCQEFLQLASIMASHEKWFLASTVDGNLKFFIGDNDAATDRSSITFAENVDGELKGDLYWDLTSVTPVIKLGLDEDLKISITNRGALQIRLLNSLAEYKFIFPARRR